MLTQVDTYRPAYVRTYIHTARNHAHTHLFSWVLGGTPKGRKHQHFTWIALPYRVSL